MNERVLIVTDRELLPPWSGNRVRILGLIRALRDLGCDVVLVTSAQGPRDAWGNLVQGVVITRARSFQGGRLDTFDVRPFRRSVERVATHYRPSIAIAEYAWLAPTLTTLPRTVTRFVDCHDVLHTRTARFLNAHVDPWVICTRQQEVDLLRSAHVLIATQHHEAGLLKSMLPDKKIVCLLPEIQRPPTYESINPENGVVLAVGSRQPGNDGIREFALHVWSKVIKRLPQARLNIVGTVAHTIPRVPNVNLVGPVADLQAEYCRAAVVICPITVGTGVKMKMLEALRLGKAIVATSTAAEGLPTEPFPAWISADSPAAFTEAVIGVLTDVEGRRRLEKSAAAYGERHLSKEVFSKQLQELLRNHSLFMCKQQRRPAASWNRRSSYSKEVSSYFLQLGCEAESVARCNVQNFPSENDQGNTTLPRFDSSPATSGLVDQPSVSVIIPCKGWQASLPACVRSVLAQDVNVRKEVVVILNAPEFVAPPWSWPGVTVVWEPKVGPASARNKGVRESHGDVLAFIDSDCVAFPRWLEHSLVSVRQNGDCCVVAGGIRRPDPGGNWVSLYDRANYLDQERYVKSKGACVTANMVVARRVFDRVGPFDEEFVEAAFEDWEWTLRARSLGYAILYDDRALVEHPCMHRLSDLRAKVERLARGKCLWNSKNGGNAAPASLIQELKSQVFPAIRNRQMGALDRTGLACVGLAAAFWSWNASRCWLRTGRG